MTDNPLILSIETATRRGSVCLTRGSEVIASAAGGDQVSHSNTLLKQIDDLLNRGATSLAAVELFAAASGPGSFTGLRIGLATVKGLAATLGRPCVGIPTLQAVALSGGTSPVSVALLPAGRGELFAQMFAVTAELAVVSLDQPTHLPIDEVLEKYSGESNVLWCGEGVAANQEKIQQWAQHHGRSQSGEADAAGRGWCFAPDTEQLALHVAALARARFDRGETGDPKLLRAIYVRPSDAELNSNVHNAASS